MIYWVVEHFSTTHFVFQSFGELVRKVFDKTFFKKFSRSRARSPCRASQGAKENLGVSF
jgi:hypothetical protein